ncbi:MAG: metallophosphoesterase [Acidobacteria bacterium]|nr:metallophosphoesterase [Acidobacteriota bacterium]
MDKKPDQSLISRREVIKSVGAIAASTLINPSSLITATPVKNKIRFIVFGDWGFGSTEQLKVAKQMILAHQNKPIDLVLTVGDNIYGTGNKEYYRPFFEQPYAPLLNDNVKFFATLGNHDVIEGRQDEIKYPLFNMGGREYYTIARGQGLVEFFMLDVTNLGNQQLAWLENSLKASKARWKIALYHYPIYSSGTRHGSALALRKVLEPLLVKYKVNIAFAGHDHIYERTFLQNGIQHFVTGGGGAPLYDIDLKSPIRAASYVGWHFMLVEIDDKGVAFQVISDSGKIVDSSTIK